MTMTGAAPRPCSLGSDVETRKRLHELAREIDCSTAAVLRTLSFATPDVVETCRRLRAESRVRAAKGD